MLVLQGAMGASYLDAGASHPPAPIFGSLRLNRSIWGDGNFTQDLPRIQKVRRAAALPFADRYLASTIASRICTRGRVAPISRLPSAPFWALRLGVGCGWVFCIAFGFGRSAAVFFPLRRIAFGVGLGRPGWR